MNNVVFVLVDSVFVDCIQNGRTKVSTTPFLDSIIPNSIFADNVFSYGPYTDAATKGLYSGTPTLSSYGYYFGVNSADDNIFKMFKQDGYDVCAHYVGGQMFGSKTSQYMDRSIYLGGMDFITAYRGRFDYYASQRKIRELNPKEYEVLTKGTEFIFDCLFTFYDNIENQPGADKLIKIVKIGEANELELLDQEKKRFIEDKISYVNELLEQGKDHALFRLNGYASAYVNKPFVKKKVYGKYRRFFSKMVRKNIIYNLRNNYFSLRRAKEMSARSGMDIKRILINYYMNVFSVWIMKYRSLRPGWRSVPSMYRQVMSVIDEIESHKGENPFFVAMHAEEPHNNMAFFSYDIDDEEEMKKEIEYLSPLVDGIDGDFKGNITYLLAIRYADYCIKKLVEYLREKGLMDNTTLVITADHGSSYSGFPTRAHVVNSFHRENYNVPLIIYGAGVENKAKRYHGFYSAGDVLPTISDVVGVRRCKSFIGKSIFELPDGRDYVMTEFMGGGTPDMMSREVWISIRSKHYMIAYLAPINKELDIVTPVSVYDLVNDKYELNNIKDSINFNDPEIVFLCNKLKERFVEIQEETNKIISNLDSLEVEKK